MSDSDSDDDDCGLDVFQEQAASGAADHFDDSDDDEQEPAPSTKAAEPAVRKGSRKRANGKGAEV